jgi:hypothetical protein
MGAAASCRTTTQEQSYQPSEWKIWSNSESLKTFTVDSSLPSISEPDQLLLLQLLKEPLGQASLGQYAKSIDKMELLMCWIDIEEYKQIVIDDQRRDTALQIFKKYLLRKILSSPASPEPEETLEKSIQESSMIFSITNLVDAMSFINAGVDEHSFAPVRSQSSNICKY